MLTGVQHALSHPASVRCDETPLGDKQREAALLAGVQHALTFSAAVQCKAAKLSVLHDKVALLTDPTTIEVILLVKHVTMYTDSVASLVMNMWQKKLLNFFLYLCSNY